MSTLKVNTDETETSIAKNAIFMLSYKETTKTIPSRKNIGKKNSSMVYFLQTVNYKLIQSETNLLTVN